MPIHERVLEAALRICRERGRWSFGPREVVVALADLNPGSVRTHVMSRCCVNAPAHHAHRWPYFRRVHRGVYEILPAWRRWRGPGGSEAGRKARGAGSAARGPLRLRVDLEPDRPDPVIEAYEKDIDRTLVRQGLRMTCEERLLALEGWLKDTEELRGAARPPRRRAAR